MSLRLAQTFKNVIMRFVITCIFLLLAIKSYSQANYVTGNIIDNETRLPIQDLNVTVFNGLKKVFQTITDDKGHFVIPLSFFTPQNYIKITSVNYVGLKISYPSDNDNTLNTNINLGTLKISALKIELKEVKIKPKERYRDTTEINFSAEKFERSVMIDDLLSRRMGFYKDRDGKLYYKGKAVSNIMVNGGDFFGKNNLDIYKNLPALILNSMEIVETDIDSVTNTTLLRSEVKINLKLKDKYKKGKFGTANLGLGTSNRYMVAADVYTYNKNEQVSFSPSSNNTNVGDNASLNPTINFSANGNNSVNSSSKFTYRNLFYKNKIELNIFAKGKLDNLVTRAESELKDESINRLSKTATFSNAKTRALEALNFVVNYDIDSLNSLRVSQIINYSNTRKIDSLGYNIQTADSLTRSLINKTRDDNSKTLSNNLYYQKRFSSKKGRQINFNFSREKSLLRVNETNLVSNYANNTVQQYFVEQNRDANKTVTLASGAFIEPLGYTSYITFSTSYKVDKFNYHSNITNDTIPGNSSNTNLFTYRYFNQAIKAHKIFNKFVLDFTFLSIFNTQSVQDKYKRNFWYADINWGLDYQLKKGKRFSALYSRVTQYPDFDQLSGINNSFDLVSQTQGNIKLKPQINNKLALVYDLKKTDSINLSLTGNIELFTDKFGYNINTTLNQTPAGFIDNVGNSINADIGFSFTNNLTNGNNIDSRTVLTYQETPSTTNQIKEINRSIGVSQALSTNRSIIRNTLSVSPGISITYSKYYYKASVNNQFNLSYTDKFTWSAFKFELTAYPLLTYSYSIKSNFSFATNAEIKRKFLKKYAEVWLKGYDIFNSFSFNNNINGPYYVQTVKYSNLNRYFLLGISIKFNNMK